MGISFERGHGGLGEIELPDLVGDEEIELGKRVTVTDFLEDLGEGLGVTDSVSGPVVLTMK